MRAQGLGRGLSFALFAGLGSFPWLLCWRPVLGFGAAFAAYILLLSVGACLWLAPNLRVGVSAAALVGIVLAPVALFAATPATAFVAAGLVWGLARSGVMYRHAFVRAFAIELVFFVGAASCAAIFYDARLFGTATAVWVFWLVQSAYGLFSATARGGREGSVDAFVQARLAAEQLMRDPRAR